MRRCAKKALAALLVAPFLMVVVGLEIAKLQEKPFNYLPPKGYVPDEATALAVGRAVLLPVYGNETIDKEEPLIVTLDKGVWEVESNTHAPRGRFLGGVAEVWISKKTGAILRMLRGK